MQRVFGCSVWSDSLSLIRLCLYQLGYEGMWSPRQDSNLHS